MRRNENLLNLEKRAAEPPVLSELRLCRRSGWEDARTPHRPSCTPVGRLYNSRWVAGVPLARSQFRSPFRRGTPCHTPASVTWIDYKRKEELAAVRVRPHPYEFAMYFDA